MARLSLPLCLLLLVAISQVYEVQGHFLLRHYLRKFPRRYGAFRPYACMGMMKFVDLLQYRCANKQQYKMFFGNLRSCLSLIQSASGSANFESQLKGRAQGLQSAIAAMSGGKASAADSSAVMNVIMSMGKTFAQQKQSESTIMTFEQRKQLIIQMVSWARTIGQVVASTAAKSGSAIDMSSLGINGVDANADAAAARGASGGASGSASGSASGYASGAGGFTPSYGGSTPSSGGSTPSSGYSSSGTAEGSASGAAEGSTSGSAGGSASKTTESSASGAAGGSASGAAGGFASGTSENSASGVAQGSASKTSQSSASGAAGGSASGTAGGSASGAAGGSTSGTTESSALGAAQGSASGAAGGAASGAGGSGGGCPTKQCANGGGGGFKGSFNFNHAGSGSAQFGSSS